MLFSAFAIYNITDVYMFQKIFLKKDEVADR